MASCMECIHFNPCNSHGKIIVEKPTEGNDWGLHDNVENECKYFTPTADVVEVVRCKDCRRCEVIIDQFDNDWYFCTNSVNNAEVKADDFCSYGERRTDDDL